MCGGVRWHVLVSGGVAECCDVWWCLAVCGGGTCGGGWCLIVGLYIVWCVACSCVWNVAVVVCCCGGVVW